MFILNELKDFCIYNNRKIIGVVKDTKNTGKNIAILSASSSLDETANLYNTILYKNTFRSFYVPYSFHTIKTKKLIKLKQKEIYAEVKAKMPNINKYRLTIDLYKNANVIYDLSYETPYVTSEIKVKGLTYIKKYLEFISSKYSTLASYKNRVIAVPVPDNSKITGMTINNNENSFCLLYLAMYKGLMPEALNDVTFMFYTLHGTFIKFKYTDTTKKADILKAFSKITKVAIADAEIVEDEVPLPTAAETIVSVVDKTEVMTQIKDQYLTKLGVPPSALIGDALQVMVTDLTHSIDEKILKLNIDFEKLTASDIIKILTTEPDIIRQSEMVSDLATKGRVSDAYVEKLQSAQNDVIFNGEKLSDILNSAEKITIDDVTFENPSILNEEVKHNKTIDFDNSYYAKQNKKDLANIFSAFNNDEDVKLFVKDIQVENTSDVFTKKETYTIKYQDEKKQLHTFKINYPILKDGKFIISGGGRKLILKQLLLLPIVKTKPDIVQITTNYNKLFVYRFGEKLSDGTEFIKKLLLQDLSKSIVKDSGFNYRRGNTSSKNKGFETSLEYTELSKNFSFIENKKISIVFNQKEIINIIASKGIKPYILNESIIPVGFIKEANELVYVNTKTGEIFAKDGKGVKKVNENLTYFIIENILKTSLTDDKMKEFYAFSPSKTLAYTRARITGRTIPTVVILSYETGLQNVIERYGISYEFVKKDRVAKEFGKKRLKFKDGYLIYSSLDLKSTLLLDGLTLIDTAEWNFEQMNTKDPYIEYFNDFHGSRNIGKGLHNMLSLMVDPITKEVLEDLKLPTNIIDIMLYANTLLSTSNYKAMNDMSCYRLRGAEQVNAVLYKILADSFKTYKDTSNNGNPIKISVDPDILFKKLNSEKTVDEYSILNPSLEVDKASSVTYKGPSGINLDDAYTTELRAYSPSMYGIVSTPTPDSAKCGAVRQLAYDPKILNIRGMLDLDRSNRNTSTNLYCPSELLNNFTCTHADPPRIGMQTTQQKHTIPVNVQSRPLFGTGIDKTLPYVISDDFVVAAIQGGTLEKIDNKNELAILKYDDGTTDVIDISEVVSKNSNGGFYIANRKELTIKEGQKFKKGSILAKNPSYFKGSDPEDVIYSTGKLCKIAIVSRDGTFEDSSMISQKMSKDMTTNITMKKEVNLGVNSNVEFVIKKGAHVKTGDPLVIFDTSFEDSSINMLLGDLGDEIDELTTNELHSKYTGRIVDINMYYNHEIEEYTPSVQKILKEYVSKNKTKVKVTNDLLGKESLRLVNVKAVDKINTVKIKGTDVDGILIEIFIEYEDALGVGDKITFATALKTTISDVFDEGEAPYTEFEPDEELDAVFPSLSIITRMTTDLYFQLFLNKGLLGLKKEVAKIWNE